MTTSLSPGGPYSLTQNTVYALPPRSVFVQVVSGKTIESSMDGSTFAAVTLGTNNLVQLVSPFLRSTAADTIISIKYA